MALSEFLKAKYDTDGKVGNEGTAPSDKIHFKDALLVRKRFWYIVAGLECRCAYVETRLWLCGPGFDEVAKKAH